MLQDASFAEAIVTNFKDDQETPDIYNVHFDYGDKAMPGKSQSLRSARIRGCVGWRKLLRGEKRPHRESLVTTARSTILNNKVVREIKASTTTFCISANFIEAIRSEKN